ncbi:MAG: transporter permease [Dehalococcoidia bacterium]|nr:transporter permease [Dehalococcoidia bacterium]
MARFRYLTDNEKVLGSVFLFPAIAYIVLLVGIPFALAIAFSLANVTVGNTTLTFAGLENYRRILQTPEFRQSLLNTFFFTIVSQAITLVLANALALILSAELVQPDRLGSPLCASSWQSGCHSGNTEEPVLPGQC